MSLWKTHPVRPQNPVDRLIQLYTSFIYEGPTIARAICRDLAAQPQALPAR